MLKEFLLFFGDFHTDKPSTQVQDQHHDSNEIGIGVKEMQESVNGVHHRQRRRHNNRKTHPVINVSLL